MENNERVCDSEKQEGPSVPGLQRGPAVLCSLPKHVVANCNKNSTFPFTFASWATFLICAANLSLSQTAEAEDALYLLPNSP